MASGFNNNIRVSLEQGWKTPLQPIITVNYIAVVKFNRIAGTNGINLFIQISLIGTLSSSTMLLNLQRRYSQFLIEILKSKRHDSNTTYIPVSKVYDIRKFYDVNFTDYCSSIGPKIKLLFDLLIGYSYERASMLKQIDKDTIEFTGSSYQIIGLYDKIMNCPEQKSECDKTREEIIQSANFVEHPMKRFILESGCSMVKDLSNITVRFKRV